jgi:iron complex outermembrane recepter protein
LPGGYQANLLNLGAAAHVEVLRGPSSPIYGPGKVGGLMNYVPRTARGETGRYVDEIEGSITLTAGDYGRAGVMGEVSIPAGQGGFHLYAEHIDHAEYYRHIDPVHTNLQATYVGDAGGGWSFEANAMYFNESGRIQAPGWNRLTQDLIDTGTYVTGRDTAIADLDGDGFLSYAEIDAAIGQSGGLSNIRQIREYGGRALPEFALDEGVGTTRLSRRTVFADEVDFNDTETFTGYAALRRDFSGGSRLAFELFGDNMRNERYNSCGCAACAEATAARIGSILSTAASESPRIWKSISAEWRSAAIWPLLSGSSGERTFWTEPSFEILATTSPIAALKAAS